MIQATYQQLIERIAHLSGLSIEEIQRRVEAKKARLSGLISNEGAAQVVASELGISFEKQKFKIMDLLIGMKKVQVIGKILEIYPIRKYRRAEHEGEVASMLLADDSSNIRVVLWDQKHIDMIKTNTIAKDKVIDIKGADVRGTTNRELHLGSGAELEVSEKVMDKVVTERQETIKLMKLSDMKINEAADVYATIVQIFQPSFFSVCPECSMKVSYEADKAICLKHGNVAPRKRSILNMVIDDGTDNVRALLFSENVAKLLKLTDEEIEKLQDPQFFLGKKQEILGSEWLFSGKMRQNILFNRTEFLVNDLTELEPEQLIKELGKEQV